MSVLSNIDMLIAQDAYITKNGGLNRLSLEGIKEHIEKIEQSNTDLLEALEAMLGKAYKQNWNDNYPDQVAQAQSAVDKARSES